MGGGFVFWEGGFAKRGVRTNPPYPPGNGLGLPTCRKLKLVTLNYAVSEDHPPLKSKEDVLRMYQDCFECIGKFRETFHITLDPTVTPVVHATKRCPIHIKDEVKNEINQMVDLGVIEKVDDPTDWLSSIVFSRKSNGKLHICLYHKHSDQASTLSDTYIRGNHPQVGWSSVIL